MNKDKVAIMVDSCCDVPKEYVDRYGMYVIPLKILYKDREYLDGVDITPQEVYDRLSEEIPKTSLPEGRVIEDMFLQIRKDGYEKVIVVTLSSGLSGTNNMVHLIASQIDDLEIFVLDTKNISMGAGFHAIQAAHYLEMGYSFAECKQKLLDGVDSCKVFFVLETLEYLQKGGRIGLVASLFGNALNLKPIISCNPKGIYYTVAKVRGRRPSIRRCKEMALAYAANFKKYHIAIMHGGAEAIAREIEAEIRSICEDAQIWIVGQVTPAIGVHTGPGTIGFGIMPVEE